MSKLNMMEKIKIEIITKDFGFGFVILFLSLLYLSGTGSSPWSEWSPCSGSCGGGIQQRQRLCEGSTTCSNEEGQQRTCNMFSCIGTLNALEAANVHRSSLRPSGRPSAYKLLPSGTWRSKEEEIIFPRTFPWEFSLLVTVRVKQTSSGGFLLRVLHSGSLQVGLYISDTITLVLSDKDNVRVSFVKSLFDDHWNQIAFSVRRNTVSFYVNCEFNGKLPLPGKIRPFGGQPATVIVGSTGPQELDAFQGDIEQITISGSPDDAEKQCNSTTQPLQYRTGHFSSREEVRSRPITHHSTQNDQLPLRGDLIDDEDFSFDEKGSGDKSDEDYDEDYEEDDEKDTHKHKEKDKIPIKAESPEESFIDDNEEDEEEETADDDDVDFSEEENNETIIKELVEPFVATEKHDFYQKDEKQNEITEKPVEKPKALEEKKEDEKKVEEKKVEEKKVEEKKIEEKKENEKREEEKKENGKRKEEKKEEKEEEEKEEKNEKKKEEKNEKKNQDVVIEDTIYRDDYDYNHPDDELDKNEESVEGSGTGINFELAWSEWSPCSSTCNWGRRTRTSYCVDNGLNLESCSEASSKRSETEACFVKLCPSSSTTISSTTTMTTTLSPISVYNKSIASALLDFFSLKSHCKVKCLNGGTCHPPYKCKCPPAYHGNMCQYALCKPTCLNGGFCVAPNVCRCKAGYIGKSCHKAICQHGCKNGGECVAPNKCACRSGFTGRDCGEPLCDPVCQNGGTCVKPYFCHCPPGTKGAFCEKLTCKIECLNGGSCIGPGKCACTRGFTGSNCEQTYCPGGCLNGGKCGKTGKCSCPSGYSGLHCEIRKPCKFVEVKEPYKRGFKRKVATQVKVPCGAWGWKMCTKTKVHYETIYKTFFRTSYECEDLHSKYPEYQKLKTG